MRSSFELPLKQLLKQIVESHGGRLWADANPEPKRGTTFYFTLPIEAS
jgi:signal transduction histidine kinase